MRFWPRGMYLVLLLAFFVLVGCQPKVYLMPTPSVLTTGEHDFFKANPTLEQSNLVPVFYATNRKPVGTDETPTYTIFGDKDLRLGVADLLIGKETTWDKIYSLSTSAESDKRPRLTLEGLSELGKIGEDETLDALSPEALRFFAHINKALAESLDKDLMVYVHGANSNVYRASAQAAQYRHFTGRNSVVLVFLWPSAESLFKYGTDVRHAAKTAPVFARLMEVLARHTNALYINILAYSAGAQIVSPALHDVSLDIRGELRRQYRLGEVYFAAPDLDLTAFADQVPGYLPLVRNVTVSINTKDRVLSFAEGHHGVSRLGRPNREELTSEAFQWFKKASVRPDFDLLVVEEAFMPMKDPLSHSFWYDHPWVSSDILIQFLFHASPGKRGLEKDETETGVTYWRFPEDYPERIPHFFNQILEGVTR